MHTAVSFRPFSATYMRSEPSPRPYPDVAHRTRCCSPISHASEYSSVHRCSVLDSIVADTSSTLPLASCSANSPPWLQQVAIPPIPPQINQFPDTHFRHQTSPNSRLRSLWLRQIHTHQTSSFCLPRSLRSFRLTHYTRSSSWGRARQGLLVCVQRRLPEEDRREWLHRARAVRKQLLRDECAGCERCS